MFDLEKWRILSTPQYHWLMLVIALTVLAFVADIWRIARKEKPHAVAEKDVNQYNLFAHDGGIHADP